MFFIVYQRRLFESKELVQNLEKDHHRKLHEASVAAQESEQERIAKDLHDEIGAMLSTSRLYINQILSTEENLNTISLAAEAKNILSDTIISVRRISQNLKPVALERFGLEEAIQNFLKPINNTTIKADFNYKSTQILESEEQLGIYRIIQELVNNTLKHANANKIEISLNINQDISVLNYKDNGIGVDHSKSLQNPTNGLGLKSIESRISLMNGKVEYINIKPHGFGAKIYFNSKNSIKL
ncbi:sensor histidine kinase [Persicobacter sp. CCB-QB2]|uniref:sensor histidine kinase n=1 Tax=Persicobacter sp. CCB-QB2 TaxID=1561025 RepID=UPI00155DC7C7|nr:ATP-binding protein [Persicobacter sp. CCB-QB2]